MPHSEQLRDKGTKKIGNKNKLIIIIIIIMMMMIVINQ